MLFKTVKEASVEWAISERRVHVLCNEVRVEGAKKVAGVWLIPREVEKPVKLKPGRKKIIQSSMITSWGDE